MLAPVDIPRQVIGVPTKESVYKDTLTFTRLLVNLMKGRPLGAKIDLAEFLN
ncbi:MAG: hypothetical protein H7230_03475 [Candidatus Parcubacteria bacterium]|nr:hypothetical protein [Candidatus Paceibacterota bacterium]